jgi:sterol 3beta-glucosyltransferase
MHFTIIALGSHGDVQPFATLGGALKRAGHSVRLATFELFAPMAQAAGLDFHCLRGDAQALLKTATALNWMDRDVNVLQVFRALQRSYGTLAETLPADIAALGPTDCVLNQLPSNLFGPDLAEYYGVPHISVSVIPMIRSRCQPLIGFPAVFSPLPGYNLFTYRLAEQIGWQMMRASVNRLRTKFWGLKPRPFFGQYEQPDLQGLAQVCGVSQHVVERQPDWGSNVYLTGWWHPSEPAWQPQADLLRFLDAGDAPVFIGFGSMSVKDPPAFTRLVIEAVQLSGRRAILHRGWAGLAADAALPANIFPLSYAPYGWLFPRMAAVVHHGGSGTSGFGFRSGVPSLVVPFGFDQFFWGERAAQLGVGPRPVPYRGIHSADLAEAIHLALEDGDMRRRAARLGEKLRAENGLEIALRIFQQVTAR